ncbi:RraA family protein [Blastococcus brunescens]|uniref:RraA family protein n=1 Tax=Blastococcus brunescens TaxID=1564165 RepID=UPI003BEEEE7E
MADLLEAMETIPGRMALVDPSIRPLSPGLKMAGQAVTVHTFPGDGLAVHRALQLAGPGQVLVITSVGETRSPLFAELLSLAARAKGLAGVVVDGPVRDADALMESRFPVWCRGTYAGRPMKRGPGEINVPVVCGGVVVEPGDIIVADGDGVLRVGLAAAAGCSLEPRPARTKRWIFVRQSPPASRWATVWVSRSASGERFT